MDSTTRRRPTPIPRDTTGLTWRYRFFWRLEYAVLHWGGPPQPALDRDPREKLRRERAAKVEAARAELTRVRSDG